MGHVDVDWAGLGNTVKKFVSQVGMVQTVSRSVCVRITVHVIALRDAALVHLDTTVLPANTDAPLAFSVSSVLNHVTVNTGTCVIT